MELGRVTRRGPKRDIGTWYIDFPLIGWYGYTTSFAGLGKICSVTLFWATQELLGGEKAVIVPSIYTGARPRFHTLIIMNSGILEGPFMYALCVNRGPRSLEL